MAPSPPVVEAKGSEITPEHDAAAAPHPGARRAALASLLLVTALAAWLFGGVLAGGRALAERDLVYMDRPARTVLARLWRSFPDIPEWNPYAASGQPLAANPHNAVFYPLTWLFLVLPFETAFTLQVVVPVLVSFAGMVLLLLTLGRSRAAALYGGLLWGFGGFVLSAANLLPVLFTLAPVPLAAALVVRTVRRRRAVDGLLLVPAFALVCAGGEPASLLAAGVLIACAWLATAGPGATGSPGTHRWRPRAHGSLVAAAALLAGAAIAAPVLIPAARLQAKTVRAAGLPLGEATVWSFPPLRLAELALPLACGDTGSPDASRYWGSTLYPGRAYPLVYSVYAGVLTPLLALLGVGRARRWWLWAGAGAMGLALAFGRHAPVFALAYAACPPLRALRYPEKWLALPAFVLVVLAAGGVDALLEGRARRLRAASRYLAGVAAVAAGLAAGVALLTHALGAEWWWRWLLSGAAATSFAQGFPTAMAAQAVVALAGAAAVWILRRHGRTAGTVALLILAAVDLGRTDRHLLGSQDPATLDRPPSLYASLAARPSPSRLFHLAQWQALDPRLQPELAAPPAPAQWGIATALERDYDLTQLAWTRRAAALVVAAVRDPRLADPLLARRSVGDVLAFRAEPPAPATGGGQALPSGRVVLHRVPAPRPEAFCVDRIVRFGSDAEWLAAVARLGEQNGAAALLGTGSRPELGADPSPCDVVTAGSAPQKLSLQVRGRGPGPSLLAVTRTWDEWWTARLDGAVTPIVRADVNLMAVVVPPGSHALTVVYRDLALAGAIRLSLSVLVLWVSVAVLVAAMALRRSAR